LDKKVRTKEELTPPKKGNDYEKRLINNKYMPKNIA